MWKLSIVLVALVASATRGLPVAQDAEKSKEVPVPATELLPPLADAEMSNFDVDILNENTTLATELLPPFESNKPDKLGVVYIINLFAVRNISGDDDEQVLNADITGKVPGMLEPIATVLLVLEEDDESKPVSLDDFAKDLEDDGFKVEKIKEDGQLRVIKVEMDGTEDPDVELIKPGQLNKLRRRRSPKPHLGLLNGLLDKHRGNDCDPCRQRQQGGGGYGIVPVYVPGGYDEPHHHHHHHQQPNYQPNYQPQYQPQYQPPPQYYPQQNHGSHSQASAQASSSSW